MGRFLAVDYIDSHKFVVVTSLNFGMKVASLPSVSKKNYIRYHRGAEIRSLIVATGIFGAVSVEGITVGFLSE